MLTHACRGEPGPLANFFRDQVVYWSDLYDQQHTIDSELNAMRDQGGNLFTYYRVCCFLQREPLGGLHDLSSAIHRGVNAEI